MHERQTPTNLLDGRPWACWGPLVEVGHFTDRVVRLIALRSGRPLEQVGEILQHSQERGRYLLLERLSVTSHAAVYTGIDRLLARDVAVKIHRDKHKHATQRALFESQAMARLEHPNIVRILDMGEHVQHGSVDQAGEHVAWLYSVIELCDADLHSWHEGLAWPDLIRLIVEAGRGLEFLHEVGFAHGDIKPQNILIRDGVAKLADFGNTRQVGTFASDFGGTIGFIAPEVIGRGPCFDADVFALAVTAWACLFGELPYPGPTGDHVTTKTAFAAIIERVLAYDIKPPAAVPPDLPPRVLRLLTHALDPNPAGRPPLAFLLMRLQGLIDRDARKKRRRKWAPAIAAVLAVVGGVGFFVGARHRAGSDANAIFWTAAGVMNPLARAEAAAHRGEVDEAIGALYRLDARIESLSVEERYEAAKVAERIAKVLEERGHKDDAINAWFFVVHLYEHSGHLQEAERAEKARAKLLSPAPF